MKSFSVKALVLALVVVAGSVNANDKDAGFISKVKGYASSAKDGVVNAVKSADESIFGKRVADLNNGGEDVTFKTEGGVIGFRNIRVSHGFVRAATFSAVVAGAAVAVRAAYKHFTKPAVEADNAEANVETAQ